MAIAEEIREAIKAAKAAYLTPTDNPFKTVLDEVAEGLTDESVEARFTPSPGSRWTLWVSPAYQPGRATPMLTLVIGHGVAEVLLDPKRSAANAAELTEILKGFVTTPEVLESLQSIADLTTLPVDGFLRVARQTVTRDDLMLEVSPEQQRQIGANIGKNVELNLQTSDLPGAGSFKSSASYEVMESAGYTIVLSEPVTMGDGRLRIVGRVERTAQQ
jgi:hypothetical protein